MLGNMIRQLRIKRKLTQKQLADIIFVDVKSISSYETNTNMPPLPVVIALCSALEAELIVKNNCVLLKEIKSETKGDIFTMEKQTNFILEGIFFDENGKPFNINNEVDILSRLKGVLFKDLPKCYNFTIPLENNLSCVKELVLDKWTTDDGTLINSIIKQKVNLPLGITKSQAEDKIISIPIKESESGLIDLYFNDEELIIVYELYHYYHDNLTVDDVYEVVSKVSENINLTILKELNDLVVENEFNIKKLKDYILNYKPWDLDLLKFVSYIDKNLMVAFYDKNKNIALVNIDNFIRFKELDNIKHIVPVGDNYHNLKNILEQHDTIGIDELNFKLSLIYNKDNKTNLSFDELVEKLSSQSNQPDTDSLITIIEDYCKSIESSKKLCLDNLISDLTNYNVFDLQSIQILISKQVELITVSICEILLKLKKCFSQKHI